MQSLARTEAACMASVLDDQRAAERLSRRAIRARRAMGEDRWNEINQQWLADEADFVRDHSLSGMPPDRRAQLEAEWAS